MTTGSKVSLSKRAWLVIASLSAGFWLLLGAVVIICMTEPEPEAENRTPSASTVPPTPVTLGDGTVGDDFQPGHSSLTSKLWLKTKELILADNTCKKDAQKAADETFKYDLSSNPGDLVQGGRMEVLIWNTDAISAAIKESKAGHSVLLVNFANNRIPGGDYRGKYNAQEEDICRKTSLAFALDSNLGMQTKADLYPINRETQEAKGLLSPGIKVYWQQVSSGTFRQLSPPIAINIITVPAFDSKSVWRAGNESPEDAKCFQEPYAEINGKRYYSFSPLGLELTRARIELQLAGAHHMGAHTLITGAFGCGVFGNKVEQVAQLYRDAIDRYGGCCQRVIFAIPGNPTSYSISQFKKKLNVDIQQ